MKTDLFGRTEEQIVAAIAWEEKVYRVSAGWGGNEGASIALANKRKDLEVDRRLLAELRGESRVEPIRLLSGQALEKWRSNIVRMGKAGGK